MASAGDLIPGLLEAVRIVRAHGALCAFQGFPDAARTLQAEALTLDARAGQAQADADDETTDPGATTLTCPSCGTAWRPRVP